MPLFTAKKVHGNIIFKTSTIATRARLNKNLLTYVPMCEIFARMI